jgi:prepilin-type N-terminal cleavage/methylation domain-containing protein
MELMRTQATGGGRGFTLMELLVVVAAGGLLLALAGTNLTSASGGIRLQGTAEAIGGLFEAAKQVAVAEGRSCEVRVYEWEEAGEMRTGFFLFEEGDDGVGVYGGNKVVPEEPIRLLRERSTLFDGEGLEVRKGEPPGREVVAAGGRYAGVILHPSGATNLPVIGGGKREGRGYSFTLTGERRMEQAGEEKDFVMFVIEPRSGVVTTHRPS